MTVPAVILAALLVLVALVSVARAVEPDHVIPVRTYQGVTWQGDECYVRDDGAILCRGPIA